MQAYLNISVAILSLRFAVGSCGQASRHDVAYVGRVCAVQVSGWIAVRI